MTSPVVEFMAAVLVTPRAALETPRKVMPVPAVNAATTTASDAVASVDALSILIKPLTGVQPVPVQP